MSVHPGRGIPPPLTLDLSKCPFIYMKDLYFIVPLYSGLWLLWAELTLGDVEEEDREKLR